METRAEDSTQRSPAPSGTPHRYLMDEHPHFFYPTLAERVGLNEAIVLQQIHSWITTYTKDPDRYREKHYHDGAWWTWDSYPDWHKKLPYLSESTIKRTLRNLREKGLVRVGNYNTLKIDRTYWYTINYSEYDKLWANPKYTDHQANVTPPSDQNDQMEETNLTSPLPDSSALSSPPDLEEGGASAPTPPAPPVDDDPPVQEKEPEKERPHEAINVYRREFHTYPRKETWSDIVHAVGLQPDMLKLWARVCHQWNLKGYYKFNIADLIDCFNKGGVKPRGNGRHDSKQGGGIDEFLEIAAEYGAQERAAAYGD